MMVIKKKSNKLLKTLPLMLLAISLLVTAFVGCADETTESSVPETSSASSAVSENTESSATESSESVFSNESAANSEDEASQDESTVDDSQASDENIENSENNETSDESSESVSTEPEILGSGTKSDPYLMIPDEDKNVTTLEIPAGETQFYSIYRVGDTVLTLKSENAVVVHEGKTYEPKNGKVSFKIEYALASDALLFEISNKGSNAESFVLEFANPKGSQANPETIKDLDDEYKVSLEAGNEVGYFYKHIAEKDGKVRFAISASVDSGMNVQNNRNSALKTTEADEDVGIDESGNKYIEIEVQKGDELIVSVCANPDRRHNYPATEIVLNVEYV